MFLSQHFSYDRIKSIDMGVTMQYINKNLDSIHFGINRTVNEEYIGDTNYFQGVSNKPMEFDIEIAKLDGNKWTLNERQKISRWLFQNDYKEFISCDYPYIKYYAIFTEKTVRWDNGINEGFITAHVKIKDPYAYSSMFIERHVLENTENIIYIENMSNLNEYIYPVFEFTSLENQDVTFINLYDNLPPCKIDNLHKGEKIIIDNINEEVESDLPNSFRLSDFNMEWFRLVYGVNQIKIIGKIDLKIKYQFPVIM